MCSERETRIFLAKTFFWCGLFCLAIYGMIFAILRTEINSNRYESMIEWVNELNLTSYSEWNIPYNEAMSDGKITQGEFNDLRGVRHDMRILISKERLKEVSDATR